MVIVWIVDEEICSIRYMYFLSSTVGWWFRCQAGIGIVNSSTVPEAVALVYKEGTKAEISATCTLVVLSNFYPQE